MERAEGRAKPLAKGERTRKEIEEVCRSVTSGRSLSWFSSLSLDRYRPFFARDPLSRPAIQILDTNGSLLETLIAPDPVVTRYSRENDKAWKVSQVSRGMKEELPVAVMMRRVTRNHTDYERTGETRRRFFFSFIRSNDHRGDPVWEVHRRVSIRSLIVNFAPPSLRQPS